MEFKKIEFIKKTLEYGDVYSFYFKNNGIQFTPGQFCHLLVENGENREVRDMSFASLPNDDFLMFTMHVNSESYFKNHLMNLKKGDMISLFKIVGKLNVDSTSNKRSVFISGGVGITPFRSIIKSGILSKENIEIVQVQRGNHLYKDELRPLVDYYHEVTPTSFNEAIKEVINSNTNNNFYICGSKRFIDGVKDILKIFDINESQIQIEGFYKEKKQ